MEGKQKNKNFYLYKEELGNYLEQFQHQIILDFPILIDKILKLYENIQNKQTYGLTYLNSIKSKFIILVQDFYSKVQNSFNYDQTQVVKTTNEDFSQEILQYIQEKLQEKIEKLYKLFYNKEIDSQENQLLKSIEEIVDVFQYFREGCLQIDQKYQLDQEKLLQKFKNVYMKKGNISNTDSEDLLILNKRAFNNKRNLKGIFQRSKENLLEQCCTLLKFNVKDLRTLNKSQYCRKLLLENKTQLKNYILSNIQKSIQNQYEVAQIQKQQEHSQNDTERQYLKIKKYFIENIQQKGRYINQKNEDLQRFKSLDVQDLLNKYTELQTLKNQDNELYQLQNDTFQQILTLIVNGYISQQFIKTFENNQKYQLQLNLIETVVMETQNLYKQFKNFYESLKNTEEMDLKYKKNIVQKVIDAIGINSQNNPFDKYTIFSILDQNFQQIDEACRKQESYLQQQQFKEKNDWLQKVQQIKFPQCRKKIDYMFEDLQDIFNTQIIRLDLDYEQAIIDNQLNKEQEFPKIYYYFENLNKNEFLLINIDGKQIQYLLYSEIQNINNLEKNIQKFSQKLQYTNLLETKISLSFESQIETSWTLKSKFIIALQTLINQQSQIKNDTLIINTTNILQTQDFLTQNNLQNKNSKYQAEIKMEQFKKTLQNFNTKENTMQFDEKLNKIVDQVDQSIQLAQQTQNQLQSHENRLFDIQNEQALLTQQLKQNQKNHLEKQQEISNLLQQSNTIQNFYNNETQSKQKTGQTWSQFCNSKQIKQIQQDDNQVCQQKQIDLQKKQQELQKIKAERLLMQEQRKQMLKEKELRIKERMRLIEQEENERQRQLILQMDNKQKQAELNRELLQQQKILEKNQKQIQFIQQKESVLQNQNQQFDTQGQQNIPEQKFDELQQQIKKNELLIQQQKDNLENLRLQELQEKELQKQKEEEQRQQKILQIQKEKEELEKRRIEEERIRQQELRKKELERQQKQLEIEELRKQELKRQQEQQQRILEQQKLEEKKRQDELRRQEEQRKLEEQKRIQEEQQRQKELQLKKQLEEKRKLEEEQQKRKEEQKRLEEQQRIQEQKRIEEQARKLEEQRQLEQKRVEDEKKRLEEQKRIEEEEEIRRQQQQKQIQEDQNRIEEEKKMQEEQQKIENNKKNIQQKISDDSINFEDDDFDDFDEIDDQISEVSQKKEITVIQEKEEQIKKCNFGIQGLRKIAKAGQEIQEKPKEDKDDIQQKENIENPKPKRGGIRGLKDLAKKQKTEPEIKSQDVQKNYELLIDQETIKQQITQSLQEHFMDKENIHSYYSQEDFTIMKLMRVFNDMIFEKLCFFFDNSITQEVFMQYQFSNKLENDTKEQYIEWAQSLIQNYNYQDYNLNVFVVNECGIQSFIHDQSENSYWIIKSEKNSANQKKMESFISAIVSLFSNNQNSKKYETLIPQNDNDLIMDLNDMYMETLIVLFQIILESCQQSLKLSDLYKNYIQQNFNWNDELIQRFFLSLISTEQLTETIENEMTEKLLTEYAENMFQEICQTEEYFFVNLVLDEEIPTNQILSQVFNFMTQVHDTYKQQNLKNKQFVYGYININDQELNKYVYIFEIQPQENQVQIFRTINKKKMDLQILQLLEKKFKEINIYSKIYEDFPRHFLLNTCPEIVLALGITKMQECQISFIEMLQLMNYNLVPCIIDEEELAQMGNMQCLEDMMDEDGNIDQEALQQFNAMNQVNDEDDLNYNQQDNDTDINFDDDFDDVDFDNIDDF